MKTIFQNVRMRLILGIAFVLVLVLFASPQIFLNSTPQINPSFATNTRSAIGTILSAIPIINGKSPTVIFKETSKGVYAGEDIITKKTYVKIDKDVKVNVTKYTIEGKDIYLYEPEITPLLKK